MPSQSVVCLAVAVCSFAVLTSGAEFVPSPESLVTRAGQTPPLRPEYVRGFDISKLTPEQRRILAFRMELLRRRRAAATAPTSEEGTPGAENKASDDLETANTYGGLYGAAFPFLGLYGLGLGGLGVGLGPLAYAGLFG